MTRLPLTLIPAPPGAGALCVRKTVKKNPCQACVEACPLRAITLVSGLVVIDDDLCNRCGQCLYACPTDALENIQPLPRRWKADRLVAPLSAQAACVAELLLWHFEKGIRAIELEPDHDGWLRAVAELNLTLKALNQPTWRLAEPANDAVDRTRRQWLRMGNDAASGTVSVGRRALRDAVTEHQLYRLTLATQRCYLCGACARICPEQAIRLHADRITLDAARCTGCGQCAAVCFPQAIKSEKQQNQDPVMRLPLVASICTHCGQAFNAWHEHQHTCPFCERHTPGMR